MEDERLSALFADFEPGLSSDSRFMARLERNMDSVELIKEHSRAMKKRNRFALIVAALVGFLCGVAFTLCYPYLAEFIASLGGGSAHILDFVIDYGNLAIWGFIGLVTCVATFLTYDLVMVAVPRPTARIRV